MHDPFERNSRHVNHKNQSSKQSLVVPLRARNRPQVLRMQVPCLMDCVSEGDESKQTVRGPGLHRSGKSGA